MPDGGCQEQRVKITWGQKASTRRLPFLWAGTSRLSAALPRKGMGPEVPHREEEPKTSPTPEPASDHSFGQPEAIKTIL